MMTKEQNDLYEKQKKEAEELGFSPIHPYEELDFSDTPPTKENSQII